MRDLNDISLADLEEKIEECTGVRPRLTLSPGKRNGWVELSSNELVDQCGMMRGIYTSVSITGTGQIDADTEVLWLPVDFSYDMYRGSNGAQLMTAWYDYRTTDWTFRTFIPLAVPANLQ